MRAVAVHLGEDADVVGSRRSRPRSRCRADRGRLHAPRARSCRAPGRSRRARRRGPRRRGAQPGHRRAGRAAHRRRPHRRRSAQRADHRRCARASRQEARWRAGEIAAQALPRERLRARGRREPPSGAARSSASLSTTSSPSVSSRCRASRPAWVCSVEASATRPQGGVAVAGERMDDEDRRPPGDEPAVPHDEAYDLFQRGQTLPAPEPPRPGGRASSSAPGASRPARTRSARRWGARTSISDCYDRAAAEFSAIVEHVPTNDYARYASRTCAAQARPLRGGARPTAPGAGHVTRQSLVPGPRWSGAWPRSGERRTRSVTALPTADGGR